MNELFLFSSSFIVTSFWFSSICVQWAISLFWRKISIFYISSWYFFKVSFFYLHFPFHLSISISCCSTISFNSFIFSSCFIESSAWLISISKAFYFWFWIFSLNMMISKSLLDTASFSAYLSSWSSVTFYSAHSSSNLLCSNSAVLITRI